MKIAVFGGTFDPVHNGHLGMARYLLRSRIVEKACFLPAYLPPHKAGKKKIQSYEHRRNMLSLILEDGMEISDLEKQRGGISYTFDTLSFLTQERPEDEFCWVIGSDSLRQLHTWYRAEELVERFTFLTYPRGGETLPTAVELGEHWQENAVVKLTGQILHTAPLFPESSTEIRRKLQTGDIATIGNLLPAAVLNYIKQNQLYTGE
ncbi:MAG: nicotinate (nicotinamide) nucleotide adenylyltransferase [Lentisphaeria bacterium]|nr:nicotinate (nicotinamide) nucleotide adenylyltransferase [Lentisphaeria bacterium]